MFIIISIIINLSILIKRINTKRLELFTRVQLGLRHLADRKLRQFHDCLDPISGFGPGIDATAHSLLH